MRRAVLARDQHRCRVPGCRNATFLDVHHITPRSKGGGNVARNLLTICGAHHRGVHRGELVIEGDSAAGAVFRHADGRPYGAAARPSELDVFGKVRAALRQLGFRDAEASSVLSAIRRSDTGRAPTAETLLREALIRLTPPCTEP